MFEKGIVGGLFAVAGVGSSEEVVGESLWSRLVLEARLVVQEVHSMEAFRGTDEAALDKVREAEGPPDGREVRD